MYQTAGWSHFHLPGSINAYNRCRSHFKWLRAHRDFEWPDTYDPYNLDELRKFYDRYLKGIHNGWEMMPKVRIDVMDAYDVDYQEQRAETAWPIKRTEYRKLYLDASTAKASVETDHVQTFELGPEPVATEAKACYNPVDEEIRFEWTTPRTPRSPAT